MTSTGEYDDPDDEPDDETSTEEGGVMRPLLSFFFGGATAPSAS